MNLLQQDELDYSGPVQIAEGIHWVGFSETHRWPPSLRWSSCPNPGMMRPAIISNEPPVCAV
ncbi:MAG: hypothetical protein H6Q64_265 [Firmicutes bacterium]|nr:hypothetical protein [Bacillota bacterium]